MNDHSLDHVHVLQETLSGRRAINQKTFEALAVLTERLQLLKKASSLFEKVTLSPELERLAAAGTPAAVS